MLVRRNGDGRVVGVVSGNVFKKKLRRSRHFLRSPSAICFDVDTLRKASAQGANVVIIDEVESGDVYSAQIGDVLARGFDVDYGHGAQIGLSLAEWWRSCGERPQQLFLWEVG